MGRPGQGTGGGSRPSGGGSRSSSGHRAGSSHSTYRSNSSSSSSSRRSVSPPSKSLGRFSNPSGSRPPSNPSNPSSPSSPSGPPLGFGGGGPRPPMGHQGPPPPPPPPHYGGGYHGGGYSFRSCFSTLLALISLVAIVVVIVGLNTCLSCTSCLNSNRPSDKNHNIPSSSVVQETPNRSKITSLKSFDSNCVFDECGWTDNVKAAGAALKGFYNRTGIQPYVLFKSYEANLNTEDKKHKWADDYFATKLENNPTAVLLVYFCEANETDDGWCELVIGETAGKFVDAGATDIFWGIFDDEWYSDSSTDDVICNIFNRFADSCLR